MELQLGSQEKTLAAVEVTARVVITVMKLNTAFYQKQPR